MHAPAKYLVTPKDRGQAKLLAENCSTLSENEWRAACARYVRSGEKFFASARHPLALLVGGLNQFTADAKPSRNGVSGHSLVTAGKDYTDGADLFRKKAPA